jgi:hypothetical protein
MSKRWATDTVARRGRTPGPWALAPVTVAVVALVLPLAASGVTAWSASADSAHLGEDA